MYIESKDDKNYGITENLDKIKTIKTNKNITIKTNKSTKMPLFMPY